MSRGAVREAYAETDALTRPCPNCKVAVNAYCVHEDGSERKIACPDRKGRPAGSVPAVGDLDGNTTQREGVAE